MVENFINKMVTVHGFSPEEARQIVRSELEGAFDERSRSRRLTEPVDS